MQTTNHLVFDVGFHKGEDSRFYLRKGFRVVAFEANPQLIEAAGASFGDELASGQLTIVEGAITDDPAIQEIEFFIFEKKSEFGTTSAEWAQRNDALGFAGKTVRVPAVNFAECIERYGVPLYCKIDIEGADRICLDQLASRNSKPKYVSIESDKTSLAKIDEELDILESMGFNRFALVQQATIGNRTQAFKAVDGTPFTFRFAPGSSGPFGEDLRVPWMSRAKARKAYEAVFESYRRFGDATAWQQFLPLKALTKVYTRLTDRGLPGWYDTHATQHDLP